MDHTHAINAVMELSTLSNEELKWIDEMMAVQQSLLPNMPGTQDVVFHLNVIKSLLSSQDNLLRIMLQKTIEWDEKMDDIKKELGI